MDTIYEYVMTADAGVRYYCPACEKGRVVWVATTMKDETIVGCSACQYIILRKNTKDIRPLSVNRS